MAGPVTISRKQSFFIILLIYLVAISVSSLISYLIYLFITPNIHILILTLIADIIATLIVWSFGIYYRNSSIYDPYWSVIPVIIIIAWFIIENSFDNIAGYLFLAAILIWASRLTFNWAVRWKGIQHQDWRYTSLKEKNPNSWFFTNLVGINLMPTLIVFVSLIPAYFGIISENPAGILTYLGFAICISAVLIQYFADRQLDAFRRKTAIHGDTENTVIDTGLWRYSRHPNYFGEVSFWWGIWIMQMGRAPLLWYTVAGPVIMTLLFLFISIPMMEDHIKSTRPDYAGYRKRVSMLIPWFRFKK